MQISTASNPAVMYSLSMIKTANEQPKLAGDLIKKAIAGMQQAQQTAQSPAQPVALPADTGNRGEQINITA